MNLPLASHLLAHAQHVGEKEAAEEKAKKLLIRGDMMYFWGFCVILDIFNLNIIEPLLPSLWGEAEKEADENMKYFWLCKEPLPCYSLEVFRYASLP
jgi:hypothetical protein